MSRWSRQEVSSLIRGVTISLCHFQSLEVRVGLQEHELDSRSSWLQGIIFPRPLSIFKKFNLIIALKPLVVAPI